MCIPVNFPIPVGQFFAGHLQTATSECSLFHDFSEKKIVAAKCPKNKLQIKKDVIVLRPQSENQLKQFLQFK